MCRQLFAFVFLCGVVGIRCQDFLGFGLETRGLEPVQIEHYDNVGNQTFVFRFHFEDGSVASGSGVLIAGIDHRLQNGYFRFPIRGKIYEFNYHIDDSGADHGSLTSVAPNGTIMEEKYETDGKLLKNGFGFARRQHVFLDNEVFDWYMKLSFPANENHPLFLCKFKGHSDAMRTRLDCVTYENRSESVVGHTPNKPETEWRHDFIEPVSKTLSFENHHDESGEYSFKYNFSSGASISEIGTLHENNTVSSLSGSITFSDLQLKYTANATAYDVTLYYNDAHGTRNHAKFVLQATEKNVYGVKKTIYSDGKEFSLSANRAAVTVNGSGFVRANIEVAVPHPNGFGLRLIQKFNIAELLSDASLAEASAPLMSLPMPVFYTSLMSWK